MSLEVGETLGAALGEAVSDLIVVAVSGGLLFWGVFMGKLLGTGFFDPPSRMKVAFISMPAAVVVAAVLAFCSLKWVVNPGETRAEPIHDAEVSFFLVLLPLWAGCIWGAMKLNPGRIERGLGGAEHGVAADSRPLGRSVSPVRRVPLGGPAAFRPPLAAERPLVRRRWEA